MTKSTGWLSTFSIWVCRMPTVEELLFNNNLIFSRGNSSLSYISNALIAARSELISGATVRITLLAKFNIWMVTSAKSCAVSITINSFCFAILSSTRRQKSSPNASRAIGELGAAIKLRPLECLLTASSSKSSSIFLVSIPKKSSQVKRGFVFSIIATWPADKTASINIVGFDQIWLNARAKLTATLVVPTPPRRLCTATIVVTVSSLFSISLTICIALPRRARMRIRATNSSGWKGFIR